MCIAGKFVQNVVSCSRERTVAQRKLIAVGRAIRANNVGVDGKERQRRDEKKQTVKRGPVPTSP